MGNDRIEKNSEDSFVHPALRALSHILPYRILTLLSFLIGPFGLNWVRNLAPLIVAADTANIRTIEDLLSNHRGIEDTAISKAKKSIRTAKRRDELDHFEVKETRVRLWSYRKGIRLLRALLLSVGTQEFLTSDLLEQILDTWGSTVWTSSWLWTKKVKDGDVDKEFFRIKKGDDGSLEIAFIRLAVESRVERGWLVDSSNVLVRTEFKMKKFLNLESLIGWLGD